MSVTTQLSPSVITVDNTLLLHENIIRNAIEIKNLDFYYGNQQILKNISLPIKENKITALIGASGSGKSTLLRTLNLIFELYPDQKAFGEVWFKNKNILTHHPELSRLRAEIGMVFQKPTPFPMSIFENIAFAIRLHEKISKKELHIRVERALRQAALWDEVKDKLNQDASKLSGGQQQRLCIARTIAINPEVILLDEPTAALDPISTQKIEQLIKELSEHYTVIMVTHNMAQAKRMTDFTAYMSQGEIVEYNTTQQFFIAPRDPRSRAYIHSE
jgi:phosphate transport system ATP-binding protein